ncbi:hypothetical protein R1sor_017931 [Riccia sorocarpa]|uniref:Helicase MOV-10-like beta-barrel domain-containing protein n=1 Tax=Riccia sorocarpa TaxID=122646 RepID=A0ABD3IA21_9MARC
MQEEPYRNRLPYEYFQYLCQFSEKKLKALQEAFLAGQDLLPYLEGKVFSYLDPRKLTYQEFFTTVVPLTTAVCWSLAAPDALKRGNGKSSAKSPSKKNRPVESWEAAPRPPAGPLDNVVQGEYCALSGWMKDWKGSDEQLSEIKTVIAGAQEELGRDKFGVKIIGHADFGLKRVAWSSTETLAIPYDRPVPYYYRSLVIVNRSSESVVLLDVCGVPSNSKTFSLKDDYGLAHHYDVSKDQQTYWRSETPFGVTLRPGAEYQVMVELRCSPQDISLHQQWLLFMFGKGGAQPNKPRQMFSIGRPVSALVGHNVQDVHTILSTEAKPFYPAYLRQLFDTRPTFPKTYSNMRPEDWRRRLDAVDQTYASSLWPLQLAKLEEAVYYGMLAGGLGLAGHGSCLCTVVQLRQFSRLLALEEAAMERDIKEHDLFTVPLRRRDPTNFVLEVPGLPENRPSVFPGDLVYLRWERLPGMECAADVVVVEFQPKPQLTLKLPGFFLDLCPSPPEMLLVHVRFTFNRLVLYRMHHALQKVASLSMKLVPCSCGKVPGRKVNGVGVLGVAEEPGNATQR